MRTILRKTSEYFMRYKYKSKLKIIKQIGKSFTFLSHKHLLENVDILKQKLTSSNDQEFLLEKSFALVRESTKRVLGISHFDVQLIGGMVLSQGNVAEMKTGEGKSIVALLPTFLYALYGLGSHVITVNDYLAKRDAKSIGQVYEFLGLTVGLIQEGMEAEERKINYNCDVTYLTNNQLAFDYLKSNMAISLNDILQRQFFYCLIDEIDSILLDTARVPLILSGVGCTPVKEKYLKSAHLAHILQIGVDYLTDEKNKTIILTDLGITKCKKFLKVTDLYNKSDFWVSYLLNSIRSKEFFKKDIEYIIDQNDKIILVDEFTGRTIPRLRLNNGLHQSIEAKENILIKNKNETLASITYQGLFCLYEKLSGMTGTATNGEYEFKKMYNLKVIQIPANRPCKRQDFSDLIYKSQYLKWKAVIRECFDMHTLGRPVLVCTTSIAKSELLFSLFRKRNVRCYLLNAKPENVKIESEIICQAGYKSAITISTAMAGRGTDIKLGGDANFLTKKIMNNFLIRLNNLVCINLIKRYKFYLTCQPKLNAHEKRVLGAKEMRFRKELATTTRVAYKKPNIRLSVYRETLERLKKFFVIPQRSLQNLDEIDQMLKKEKFFYQFLSKSYRYPVLAWVKDKIKIKYPLVTWSNFTYNIWNRRLLFEALVAQFEEIEGDDQREKNLFLLKYLEMPDSFRNLAFQYRTGIVTTCNFSDKNSFIIRNNINNWKHCNTIFNVTKLFIYLKYLKHIIKCSLFSLIDLWVLDFYILTKLRKRVSKIKYYIMYCFFLQKFKQKLRSYFCKKFSIYFSCKNTSENLINKINSHIGLDFWIKFISLNTIINHDNQKKLIPCKIIIRLTFIKIYFAVLFETTLVTKIIKNKTKNLGGLHVIVTERHDSSRVDMQLRGRAGRQGEPGSSRFFLSLEDKIFRIYGGDELINVMTSINFQSSKPINSDTLKKCLTFAQKKLESANSEGRTQLSNYEQFSNVLRSYIYAERRVLLKKNCLKYWLFKCLGILLYDLFVCVLYLPYILDRVCKKKQEVYFLIKKAQKIFYFSFNEKVTSNNRKNLEQYRQFLYQRLKICDYLKYIEEKSIFNNLTLSITRCQINVPIIKNDKSITLESIDDNWKKYLKILCYLQKSIQLRSYGLYNPLTEYRREVIFFFNFLVLQIRHKIGYLYVTNRDVSLENFIGYLQSK
jgi:preprotein translocase SecA subunit